MAVISVTFNSENLAEFLAATAGPFPNVIVVDNASTDGTVAKLEQLLPGRVILRNTRNIGFGPANNVGMQAVPAHVPYILFLNPDCRIEPTDVIQLLQTLMAHPQAAIVSPLMHDGSGDVIRPKLRDYSKGYRLSRATDCDADLSQPQVIGGVCIDGACFLVDAAKFRSAGGFDDRIFMYFEEDDIALRMAKRGHSVLLNTCARATHLRGQSTSNTTRVLIRRAYHYRWSKYYLTDAHLGSARRRIDVARYLLLSLPRFVWYALTMDKQRLARSIGWSLASIDGLFMTRLFRFL